MTYTSTSTRTLRGQENEPIITSLLDTDFYKFTMLQFIWKHYGDGQTEWRTPQEQVAPPHVKFSLIDRDLSKDIVGNVRLQELQAELEAVKGLRFSRQELEYLQSLGNFEKGFLRWLANLQLPPFLLEKENQKYKFDVVGDWASVMLWETLTMSVISELYFRALVKEQGLENDPYSEGEILLQESIDMFKRDPDFKVMEFASRRRSTKAWHHHVFDKLRTTLNGNGRNQLLGTSNVALAMEFGERPKGTMGHELFMVGSGAHRAEDDKAGYLWSQEHVTQQWWDYYGKNMAVWLPDTFGTDSFLATLPKDIAYQSLGFREDSSTPPIEFARKFQRYYDAIGMSRADQREISIINSNSLTAPEAYNLFQETKVMFPKNSFGIGGGLGNRMGKRLPAPNIVVKANTVNGNPVVKLSDTPGKVSGDPAELARVRELQKATLARRPDLAGV